VSVLKAFGCVDSDTQMDSKMDVAGAVGPGSSAITDVLVLNASFEPLDSHVDKMSVPGISILRDPLKCM
jgi:hypothetical protein